ncbi:hypothetical protein GCM10008018_36510 [Paenibacillus marchantiophytorum]|uniref:Uncharacterized protein n=1 Tax=Paenibacillus marchantiophytorum TaxID=1619310 RepID=A0ABQ1EUI4_9BACL|nr:hypothetical protein GCM10008018_36510 [Paenibacillus marchantiophytorum]
MILHYNIKSKPTTVLFYNLSPYHNTTNTAMIDYQHNRHSPQHFTSPHKINIQVEQIFLEGSASPICIIRQ